MDARQARTRERLRTTVLHLAERTPLAGITVVEIARAAGISRDTFYRHAPSVPALLAAALGEELDAIAADFRASSGSREERFRLSERALFDHLRRRRGVYRNAMNPRLSDAIRGTLAQHLETSLLTYLEETPEIMPEPPAGMDTANARRLYAVYGSEGTLGIMERWLVGDIVGEPEQLALGTLAAAASWWWREESARPPSSPGLASPTQTPPKPSGPSG